MAKPTEDQLAFLESHDIGPPRSIWSCRSEDWICTRLITYLKNGNGATDKGGDETLGDRIEVYEAALLEFMHLIVVPIEPKPGPRTGTNGPLEVLEIDPKLPGYVARQKEEGNIAPSPFHVTIVPANTMIAGGNVYGGDLGDYCVGYQGGVELINFYNLLKFDAGVF